MKIIRFFKIREMEDMINLFSQKFSKDVAAKKSASLVYEYLLLYKDNLKHCLYVDLDKKIYFHCDEFIN